ncbi:hypothetical protein [Aquisphaera giovannonii]|uniref:hypothetical protein n=1 Tax=Aquisphaera giovannonii TaxID=406548 RepID=UPI0011DFCFBC|nr:hypothetical protein [Aquisphaera giovannonii]
MRFLLDTDHISILQQKAGNDFETLTSHIRSHARTEIGLSIISFHEQVMGCHTFLTRASYPRNWNGATACSDAC